VREGNLAAELPRFWEDILDNFNKGFDFGGSFDDIIRVAREFGEKMRTMAPEMGPIFDRCREQGASPDGFAADPYPPTNIYTDRDGNMVLEFALAGMDESAVSVTFQGDNLILSARIASRADPGDQGPFAKRGFQPRNIDRQKYRVPADDFAQELSKAVFKNGLLTVTVPPKATEGIKIEIVKEGI
jgi:HSP20 family protein